MEDGDRVHVFEYLDYRALLRDLFARRKAQGRGFSHRAFARRAGLRSTNFLHLVISGKRNLSAPMASRFAEAFGLERDDAAYFCDLVAFNLAKTAAERARSHERLLVLSNPSCAVAACGSCLYDASFDIDVASTLLDDSAKVPLIQDSCPGNRRTVGNWQLQANEDSGIACKYPRSLGEHARRVNACGKMNMPCRNSSLCGYRKDRPNPEPCDEGLTCTPVSDSLSMRLKNCGSNDECTLNDALECRDDVCQLK